MPPVGLFFLHSHGHAAVISAAHGPLAVLLQASGYFFVLIAAGLIVLAMERLGGE